jgi:YD repeat-containing protein
VARTAPDRPLQVVFDWTALDGSARFSGSGAARIEPPYHARLDLFGPRGEGYLSAALVSNDIRLPSGTSAVALPPAAMMWAVLGAVMPPDDARLVGTRSDAHRTELYYDAEGSRLRYTLVDGRLSTATWEGAGRRMAVALTGLVEPGLPRDAFYRDASSHTELKLTLNRVSEVESYPPDIWVPDE